MQSNFHPNISNSYPLGKNGKALSKNKQKIHCYKKKRQKGTCFTCNSSEHQIAQCPIKNVLKTLKTSRSTFRNKEVYYQTPWHFNSSQDQDQGPPNGQCKFVL